MTKAAKINALMGRPYKLGTAGPDTFDCYGLARYLQHEFYGRELPPFQAPEGSGRNAIVGFINAHPERQRWTRIDRPRDGALVSMAKQGLGYHVGTYVDLDGGLIVHTLEATGVTNDRAFALDTMGWRRIQYFMPAELP